MPTINKVATLNPFTDLMANVTEYVPRATTSTFGVVALGSGINVDALGRIYLPTFTTETDGLVPKRVGATTTKYLREDGTWVTPLNTTYGLLTKAIAEVGTATAANTISAQVLKDAIKYHAPPVTNITGNAGTATKLATGRTINGVAFDGTANIEIPFEAPTATETVAGKAKIATTAIAQAGTDDTDIITAKKLRDALNASGTAPISACRAWANFDTTTTPPIIRSSMNVSSVVAHSSGDYTVNFSVGLSTSDYALLGTASNKSGVGGIFVGANKLSVANPQTTSSVRIYVSNAAGAFTASSSVSIGVFC